MIFSMGNLETPRVTLQFNGLFDFDGMYAAIIDWAKNYGYMWNELDYKHKVPSPTGAEQEFKWMMTKDVTHYIQYQILLTVHMWDLLEVQVDADGKKKTLSNGRLYIWFNGSMTYDWQGRFKGSPFFEKLGKWYYSLNKKEMEGGYYDTLYYRMLNLHAIVKKYFDMQGQKHHYKGYLGEN